MKSKTSIVLTTINVALLLLGFFVTAPQTAAAVKYWNGAGTWTGANLWGTVSGGPYTTATWASGDIAVFEVAGTITGATTAFSSLTNNANTTFTAAGTLGTAGTVATVTVATSTTLAMGSQAISTATGTGFIKAGAGQWNLSGGLYPGGFTLSAGAIGLGGVNALGTGPLTINGGTITNTSGTVLRDMSGKPSGITIGGNFIFAGTAGITFNAATALGAATRTITVNSSSTTYPVMSLNGVISSTGGGLTKSGLGILLLGGANNYSGTTTVSGGMLVCSNANAIPGGIGVSGGTSGITMSGGTLGLCDGDFTRALGTGVDQVQFTGGGGFSAYANDRNVNLGGASAQVTWGSGSFVPTGSSLNFSHASTDKTVTFQNPIDMGTSQSRTINVNDGAAAVDAILSGALHGTSIALTVSGTGGLSLSGANDFTGNISISGNPTKLYVSSDANLGNVSEVVMGQNAGLNVTASMATSKQITFLNAFAAGGLDVATGATLTHNGQVCLTNAGVVSNRPRKTGAGNWVLNGNGWIIYTSTGTNSMEFNHSVGTLSLGNANCLNSLSNLFIGTASFDNVSGAEFAVTNRISINGAPTTFVGTTNLTLSGTVQIFGASRTISNSAGVLTITGPLVDEGAGYGFTKTGSGTLVLAGAGAYTNATTNTQGLLLVNNTSGSATGTGPVYNNASLGGTGTISGPVTNNWTVSGAGIIPGANGVGNLTLGSHLTLIGGGNMTFYITNGVNTNKLVVSGDLSASGGSTVVSLPNNSLANGEYTLIEFSGAANCTAGDFNVTAATPSGKVYTMSVVAGSPNKVVLTVTDNSGASLTWAGTAADWDIGTTLSWSNTVPDNVTFANGDAVAFGDGGLAQNTVNLTTTLQPLSVTVTNTTGTYTLSGSGQISGAASVTKSQAGALTIATSNDFTGGVTLNAGTLNVNNASALGATASTLTIAGGTIDNSSGADIVNYGNNAQNWNGDFAFTGTKNLNLGTGSVAMNSGRAVAVNGGSLTVGGTIAGVGYSLTKTGNGTLVLNGANTFTGNLTNLQGTIEVATVNNASAAGPLGNNANAVVLGSSGNTAVLKYTGANATTSKKFTVAAGGTAEFNIVSSGTLLTNTAVIDGSGNITKTGPGAWRLHAANTFSGDLALNAGTLIAGGGNTTCLGAGTWTLNAGELIFNSTAGRNYARPVTIGGNVILTCDSYTGDTYTYTLGTLSIGSYTATVRAAATLTNAAAVTLALGDVTLTGSPTFNVDNNGSIATAVLTPGIISGSYGITKSGSGTLTLNKINTFNGGVTMNAGILNISTNTALGDAAGTFTIAGGTIANPTTAAITIANNNPQQWNGDFTFTGVQHLNLGTGAVTPSGNRIITVSTNGLLVGGAIGGGAISLTKAGAGTLVLSGANTYSGGTVVDVGALYVANANAVGSGTVTLNAGHTSFAAVNSPVTLTNNLTIAGGQALLGISGGGNAALGTSSDLTVTGTVDLGGATDWFSLRTGKATFTGVVQNGGIVYNGNNAAANALTLSGNNTYAGGTTISNFATLNINSATALGTGPLTIGQAGGGSLPRIDNSSAAGLTLANNNAQNWLQNFTFLGTKDLNLGTGSVSLQTNLTLTASASTLTIGGAIDDGVNTFSFTKAGNGTVILGGANTYGGTTTNSAGTLIVNGTLGSGAVQVNAGTLGGNGTLGGAVSMAASTILAPGTSVGQLTLSSDLNLAGSGTLTMEITNAANADKIVVGGNLNPSGVTTISLPNTTPLTNGDYILIQVAGTLGGSAANFTVTSPTPSKTYAIAYVGNNVVLQVTGDTILTWTGNGTDNKWNVATDANWAENGIQTVFNDANVATFDDSGLTNLVVDIATTVSPASTTVNSSSNYVFTGSGDISGTNSITKSGGGILTISNANTFTGVVNVNTGTVVVANSAALGTAAGGVVVGIGGNIALTNDVNIGAESLSLTASGSDSIIRNLGGTNTWGGNITADTGASTGRTRILSDAGLFNVTGNIVSSGSSDFVIGGSGDGVISGNISGTRSLFKSGSGIGTWTISGSNTYAAATTVANGIMNYSGSLSNNATLSVNGAYGVPGTNIGGTLNISGPVNIGTATFNIATTAARAGVVNIKPGANVSATNIVVGAAATSFGALNIEGGSLKTTHSTISVGITLGTVASYSSFTMSGGSIWTRRFDFGANNVVATGGVSVGHISGGTLTNTEFLLLRAERTDLTISGGTLDRSGAAGGTLSIGEAAALAATMTIAGGTVNNPLTSTLIGRNGTQAAATLNLNGGSLITPNVITVIGGTAANRLNFNGGELKASANSATFVASNLTAACVFAGGAVINDGGFNITNACPLIAPVGDGVSGLTLADGGSNYIGAPYLEISGGGGSGATAYAQVDLNPASATFGQVTNVVLSNPGTGYTSTPTITLYGQNTGSGASVTVNGITANTSGGLTKLGAGTLTLTTNNTYTGSTVISNGTLLVNNTTSSGTGTGSVDVQAGTLAGIGTIAGTVNVNPSGTIQPGAGGSATGTLTCSGTVNLNGTTLININRSASPNASKLLANTLNVGGTLTVANVGAALQGNDSFVILGATSASGTFAVTNLPALNAGLNWWSTNSGSTLVVNPAPILSALSMGALRGEPQTLKIVGGKHPPTGDAGETFTVTSVTQGGNGATVSTDGTNVTYTSANTYTGADVFDYVVADTRGGYATNTVTVNVVPNEGYNLISPVGTITNGTVELLFAGIPGYSYALDWATNLAAPINWMPVITNTANTNGLVNFTNTSSEPLNFYRTRTP